ncbi:MAG: bifunctional folylpolyglutamate synthase/dihydrofolate synthase [Cyanobacteria bacterium SIG32]|nr:bifunctional folylpolyglutamate synthase/dihydrofolate synthase [Cyanobacteria bacterium SIG32]
MNYQEAIQLLTSQGKFHIQLGLERISAILELLNNPQDNLKCIHVAGTNGKGSVCSIIATVLQEAGMKVGLYTSPHILEYTERIKISGLEISRPVFANYIEQICQIADENEIHLTEFEILTAVMFKYFSDENVDVVVLETGLGGRFDATNVIKSNLCAVITHIDFDHTERLGKNLSQIAYEKAGIIKENSTIITAEGYEIFRDVADEKNAMFMIISPFEDITNLSLKGMHQQENLSLALATVRYLFPKISEDTIQYALTKVEHPYRFQFIPEKNMIIDVAHNPNGIKALKENLDFYYSDKYKRFIFGCLNNKDYKSMIEELFDGRDEIYFYHFNYPNSATIEELQAVCEYPSQEYTEKFDYSDGKLTVICGSFYMLKELLEKI